MAAVRLIVDGAALQAYLHSPAGPVGRHLIVRGTAFQEAARAQIRPRRKTGCLEDSIVKRLEQDEHGLVLRVVSDTTPCSPTRTSYSLFVHEGTKPHRITAKGDGPLAFFWENGPDGPGMYFFNEVQHPGTKPDRFFTDNLGIFAQ